MKSQTAYLKNIYRLVFLFYFLVVVFFVIEAFSVFFKAFDSSLLQFEGSALFWVSAFFIFLAAYPLIWLINLTLLSGQSQLGGSWFEGFIIRFWSGLPVSVLFTFIYIYVIPVVPDYPIIHLAAISVILAVCISPSCYLLSLEILEKSKESQFSSHTLGISFQAYVRRIFVPENRTPIRRIIVLGVARAVGESLVIYQVAKSASGGEIPNSINDMIGAMVQAMTIGDYSLVLILVLVLALFGQTIIGIGGALLR